MGVWLIRLMCMQTIAHHSLSSLLAGKIGGNTVDIATVMDGNEDATRCAIEQYFHKSIISRAQSLGPTVELVCRPVLSTCTQAISIKNLLIISNYAKM